MSRRGWFFYATVSLFMWAGWSLLSPVATNELSGSAIQILSSVGMIPVSLVLFFSPGVRQAKNLKRGLMFAAATGFMGGAGNVFVYKALAAGGPASYVFPISSMCPLVPVLAAPFLFGERLRRLQIMGVALALVAIVLLNTSPSPNAPAGAPGLLSRWMLFTLLSLALFGLTFLTQKSATYHVSDELSAIGFAGGFLLLDAYLIYDGSGLAWPLPIRSAWASILIGVTMGVGSLTLFAAYRRGKASIVSPYSQLFPVITVLAAGPLYQERLDFLRGIGVFAAIVAGVLLSIEKQEPEAP